MFKKPSFWIAIVLTLFLTLAKISFPSIFQSLENRWIDQYFKIRGPLPTKSEVVIATIDEKSLTKLGRWPWSRSTMAKLVNILKKYDIKGVGFDITFSEESSEDVSLANALQDSESTHLGYFFYPSLQELAEAHLSREEVEANDKSIFPSRLSLSSEQLESSGTKVYGVQSNVQTIAQSLSPHQQGFFNVFPDPDGVIRKIPLLLFYKGYAYPSLSLQLTSSAKGFSPIPLFGKEGRLEGFVIGEEKVPLNPTGQMVINYRGGSKTFPHFSIADILEKQVPPENLANKILLVGATAIGIYDMRVTPLDANMAGVEIQANVIDNILRGDFLIQNETTWLVSWLLFFGYSLGLGLLLPRWRALNSTLVFLLLTLALVLSGYLLFQEKCLLLQNFTTLGGGFLIFGSITVYRYFTEEKERRKIRRTFQHYLSPAVIDQLLKNPEQLKLGGERKELTVLFSDIRNFTTKAEQMPPERIVALLNDFFNVMVEVVFKHGGTIDKYMGDALMAIFGAPLPQGDHAIRASFSALEMMETLKKYKQEWCAKYNLEDLNIGIGINTGMMAVGNMGSEKLFNYTVVGDAVNLGSRLEALTKEFGCPMIISEGHYQKVKEFVEARPLGETSIRGKKEKIKIYELTGRKREP